MAYVEVNLDDFSDEDIREEYKVRRLGPTETEVFGRDRMLERAYKLHHEGKRDEAYQILWELCLTDLNKIV